MISTPADSRQQVVPSHIPATAQPEAMVDHLRQLVGRNATRWKRLRILEAVGLAVAVPLGYLLTLFLLDSVMGLPGWGRLLAGVGFFAALVLPLVQLVQRLRLLGLSEDEVALAIERQTLGGVQNRLINVLQLSRGAGTDVNESLTRAVVRENYENLRVTPLAGAAPSRPALLCACAALVLVAISFAVGAIWPEDVAHAAKRMLRPFEKSQTEGESTTNGGAQSPARLSLVRVVYHHPAYTGKSATTSESAGGDLEALHGTRAEVTFVFDQSISEATMLVERIAPRDNGDRTITQKVPLTAVNGTEFRGEIVFTDVLGYDLELRQGEQTPEPLGPFALRVLADQNPKLELAGLEQQTELLVDATIPLRIRATDDVGLEKVGLFQRRVGDTDWKEIVTWPVNRATEFTKTHDLLLSSLGVTEGDVLELVLRAVDTDPVKKGDWVTGSPQKLLIGGEGVALQRQYEQILKTEASLKALLAAQNSAAEKTVAELKKLDPASGLNWNDAKTVQAFNAVIATLKQNQEQLRQTASQTARDMIPQAGNLKISVGMLADTEMIRAIRILESVPARDTADAKRTTLAEARLTQERTARSLQEIVEHYVTFRNEWELAHMVAFIEMLAERQGKLALQSQGQIANPKSEIRTSMKQRQLKLLDLVKLAQPAFIGLEERTRSVETILADAFQDAAKTLATPSLSTLMTQAATDAAEGRWSQTASQQDKAAKELAALFARLKKAQADAALKALEALKQKAKSDAEAQKELEKLKAGTNEAFVNLKDKMKLEDIIHMRDVTAKKNGETKNPDADNYLFPDSAKGMLNPPDTGKRQDFDILKLAKSPSGTPSFPKQSDREANKIGNPPIQEKFDDLVGKLLEEADEIQKKFETYNLNTSFNINEPGEIGKQGGDLNSTAAAAATGNMKPPTSNVGGASRAGRRGARAHGMVVGSESINRRGRDKVQEGQEKTGDQAGTIREKKSEDMQKDTSTGIGGKKVEGDDEVKFSKEDAGKWTDDITKRLGKAQQKNFIVERKDGRLDPRVAELLRDMTSRQEQLIERVKSIRKELRNLYLPTDHIDEVLAQLAANLESLKEQPDAELFRLQSQALDQLRNTVKVFQAPGSGFQPSLPRERGLHGRVLDDPARDALPGYEEAVKRYYEKLSTR